MSTIAIVTIVTAIVATSAGTSPPTAQPYAEGVPTAKPIYGAAFSRKALFSDAHDVDASPPAYAQEEPDIQEGSAQDINSLRWVLVTASGYEYHGSHAEIKALLQSLQDDDNDGVKMAATKYPPEMMERPGSEDIDTMDENPPETMDYLDTVANTMDTKYPPEMFDDATMDSYDSDRDDSFAQDEQPKPSDLPKMQKNITMQNDILRMMEELGHYANHLNDEEAEEEEEEEHNVGGRYRRKIFGRDNRKPVDAHNNVAHAVGRLDVGCSATFISNYHALTAGHCVYNRRMRRWNRHLNMRRHRVCNPTRGGYYHRWKMAITVYGWAYYGYKSYDYAMIVYRTRSYYYMNLGYFSNYRYMKRRPVRIIGYPRNKGSWCPYYSTCPINYSYYSYFLHRCDVSNGMSGAGIFMTYCWRNYCYHYVYGIETNYGYYYNIGVNINKRRYSIFRNWMKRYK